MGLAGIGALRWVDSVAPVLVALQTAGPFVAIGLIVLAVATALLRRWWMLLPVGVALGVAGSIAVPPYFALSSPDSPRDVTVMAVNLSQGNASAVQVMDAVRARAVDILVTTEITPESRAALGELGFDEWFPQRAGRPEPDSVNGTMVFSRFPLTEVSGRDPADEHTPSLQPEVVVNVSGTPVRIKATHVLAPLSGATDQWRDGLRALRLWRDRQPGDQAIVLAGDFNAGTGHPAFRSLAAGLEDAHRVAGLGWVRTWPFQGRRMPPYTQIDHLLTRGLTVIDAGQVAIHGTDHAIVWAAYSIPGG
jgi:endonuclease/exonuclease/phosphatase (EEP) superfamily protein YafD